MNLITHSASGLALLAALYHLYFAYYRPFTEGEHAIIHVGLATTLIAIYQAIQNRGAMRLLAIVCLVTAVIASIYLFSVTEDLEIRFGLGLRPMQLYAGIAIISVVVILCWMEWGIVISALAVTALLYFFFGDNIRGPLQAASHPSFDYAMTFLISSGGSGLYGQITPISANIIFLFMLFGALLASTGVTNLFMELGNWLGRLLKGGAAVTCVVSSSLLGTVTGATVANVAITGTFTIPTMKRQGFAARDAGAVESVASCGGQILPPVMGAGAFIMASFLGVSYIEIAAAALLPAILFFAGVLIGVFFLVQTTGRVMQTDPPDFGIIRREFLPFVFPLVVLVYFLIQGYSATGSVVMAIGAVVATTFLRPSTWRSAAQFRKAMGTLLSGLINGARQGAALAVITAAISIVAQSLITTALGPKFASALAGFVGDNLLIALVVVMVASILLGCGLPTVAAYTMVAIMMVPALRNIGVDPLSAHMFVYYFAVFAAVTPPIATAAMVASRIAETSFWATAWASMRLMSRPLILPFLFVFHGDVLSFPPDPRTVFLPIVAWSLATTGLLILTVGYFITETSLAERMLSGVAAVCSLAWIADGSMVWLFGSGGSLLLVVASQTWRQRV